MAEDVGYPAGRCAPPMGTCLPQALVRGRYDAAGARGAGGRGSFASRGKMRKHGVMENYLYVTVLSGRNLVAADTGNSSDPFATITCRDTTFKTECVAATLNPEWDAHDVHVFELHRDELGNDDELHINVFDRDFGGISNDFLGGVAVDVSDLTVDEVHIDWHALAPSHGEKSVTARNLKAHGERRDRGTAAVDGTKLPKGEEAEREPVGAVLVRLQVGTSPTPPLSTFKAAGSIRGKPRLPIGKLRLEVIAASGLKSLDTTDESDPYALVALEAQAARTDVVMDNADPVWNQSWTLDVTELHSTVHICIYDYDMFGPDDPIGYVAIPLPHLADLAGTDADGKPLPWPTVDNPIRKWVRLAPVPEESRSAITHSVTQNAVHDKLGWVLLGVGLDLMPEAIAARFLRERSVASAGSPRKAEGADGTEASRQMHARVERTFAAVRRCARSLGFDGSHNEVDRFLTDLVTISFVSPLPPEKRNTAVKGMHGPMRRAWDNPTFGFDVRSAKREFGRFVDVVTACPLAMAAAALYLMEWRSPRVNWWFTATYGGIAAIGPLFRVLVEQHTVVFLIGVALTVVHLSNRAWDENRNDVVSVFETINDREVKAADAEKRRILARAKTKREKELENLDDRLKQKARKKRGKPPPVPVAKQLRDFTAKLHRPLEQCANMTDRAERLGSLIACKCDMPLNVAFYATLFLVAVAFQTWLHVVSFLWRTIYFGRLALVGMVLALNGAFPFMVEIARSNAANVDYELYHLSATLDVPLVLLGINYGFDDVYNRTVNRIIEEIAPYVECHEQADAASAPDGSAPSTPASSSKRKTQYLWVRAVRATSSVLSTASSVLSSLPPFMTGWDSGDCSVRHRSSVALRLATEARRIRDEAILQTKDASADGSASAKVPLHKRVMNLACRLVDRGKTRYERAHDLQTIQRWTTFAAATGANDCEDTGRLAALAHRPPNWQPDVRTGDGGHE